MSPTYVKEMKTKLFRRRYHILSLPKMALQVEFDFKDFAKSLMAFPL